MPLYCIAGRAENSEAPLCYVDAGRDWDSRGGSPSVTGTQKKSEGEEM